MAHITERRLRTGATRFEVQWKVDGRTRSRTFVARQDAEQFHATLPPTQRTPGLPADPHARFWAQVDRPADESACWNWTGRLEHGGYGKFFLPPHHIYRAHRWSYEQLVGPIPEGLVLDHLCRNPRCVDPAHLEPVTNRENLARGVGKQSHVLRTGRCQRGHDMSNAPRYGGGRYCAVCKSDRERARRDAMRSERGVA